MINLADIMIIADTLDQLRGPDQLKDEQKFIVALLLFDINCMQMALSIL